MDSYETSKQDKGTKKQDEETSKQDEETSKQDKEPLKKEAVMLELGWYKNYNPIKDEEKWYVQHIARNSLGIADIAQHMHEHNTPFSAGTIEGLLKDFVQCVNEQLLGGNIVKIDNLAIFKLAVESYAFSSPGEVNPATARLGVQARIGTAEENEKEQPAAKAVKLTAVATGSLTSKKLSSSVSLGWTTLAEAQMDEERRRVDTTEKGIGTTEKE